MTYNILNPSFSEINKISMGGRVLYRCSTSNLSDRDFLETGFKYFPKKYGFSDSVLLDYLVSSDKSMINGTSEIEKYLTTLFPSYRISDSSGVVQEYFSTYVTKNRELLCVIIPEGVGTISLLEDESEAIRVMFDSSEDRYSKVLIVLTSYESDSPVILDISYEACQVDINPLRKMSDYVLRNDSLVNKWRGVKKNRLSFMFSKISGSLVGTEELENRPIFELISEGINKGLWNPNKNYTTGEIVLIGGIEYVSLEDHNRGNHPYYTKYWAKRSCL